MRVLFLLQESFCMKRNVLKVVVAAAVAVVSLCSVANAENGTWTYVVAKDSQILTSSPNTANGLVSGQTRFAQRNIAGTTWQAWFGDWSAADKADMLAKINAMVPGETCTLTFRVALADEVTPVSTFTPTVAAFRADQDWVEAQVTTNNASTGVAWTYNGGTAANGMQNLPIQINTSNFDLFGHGLATDTTGGVVTPAWASVTLDPTVTNMLLTGTDVRGLRGYAISTQANINDRTVYREKWGSPIADPNLVLTIVPEPATLGMLSLCSLALLRRKRS